jgi:putative hemolysin
MSGANIAYLALIAVCTVASGFFSGSETAFIGASRERVHRMSANHRRGQRVQQLVSDPESLLSTLLVANNLVNILAAAVATTLFISLLGSDWGPWVATVVITAVILVFGEITPKTLAARHPERFALVVAPTIWRLSRILSPVARFFASITRFLLRLIGVRSKDGPDAVTMDDIRALAEMSAHGGHIDEVERQIIDALFDLADTQVRDVMTPRVDIVALTVPVTMEAVRGAVASTGHSRFPVTTGELDDLRGILYVKDLLQLTGTLDSDVIHAMLRPPSYIPETANILDALQEMRKRRLAIAVIVDEHGGLEGLVTAKDLLAELVGELQDEYDPGVPTAVRTGDRQWVTDGRLPLEDLEDAIEASLSDGPYSTVAGFFLAHYGHVPGPGDVVDVDGHRFTIMQMDRNRVDRLRVERV